MLVTVHYVDKITSFANILLVLYSFIVFDKLCPFSGVEGGRRRVDVGLFTERAARRASRARVNGKVFSGVEWQWSWVRAVGSGQYGSRVGVSGLADLRAGSQLDTHTPRRHVMSEAGLCALSGAPAMWPLKPTGPGPLTPPQHHFAPPPPQDPFYCSPFGSPYLGTVNR